jgi:hypothetical protein
MLIILIIVLMLTACVTVKEQEALVQFPQLIPLNNYEAEKYCNTIVESRKADKYVRYLVQPCSLSRRHNRYSLLIVPVTISGKRRSLNIPLTALEQRRFQSFLTANQEEI